MANRRTYLFIFLSPILVLLATTKKKKIKVSLEDLKMKFATVAIKYLEEH